MADAVREAIYERLDGQHETWLREQRNQRRRERRAEAAWQRSKWAVRYQRLIEQETRRKRVCGAATRAPDHHPCRNQPEPGRRRCKHHGGRSTGPATTEGRARIAAAVRARWERWRVLRANQRL